MKMIVDSIRRQSKSTCEIEEKLFLYNCTNEMKFIGKHFSIQLNKNYDVISFFFFVDQLCNDLKMRYAFFKPLIYWSVHYCFVCEKK